jgi:hypothetical protein
MSGPSLGGTQAADAGSSRDLLPPPDEEIGKAGEYQRYHCGHAEVG